jgi:hypothetical protein
MITKMGQSVNSGEGRVKLQQAIDNLTGWAEK